jgi:hypothetical protein
MTSVTTKPELLQSSSDCSCRLFDDWFDPIETGIRERVRTFIEEMIRGERDAALARPRYGRRAPAGMAGATAGSRSGNPVRAARPLMASTTVPKPGTGA